MPSSDSKEVEAKSGGLTRVVGETFGVAALVLGASLRTYGMRAKDLSLFIRIGFDDFRPFLNNHPELEKSLWFSTKLFLVRLRLRLRLRARVRVRVRVRARALTLTRTLTITLTRCSATPPSPPPSSTPSTKTS